MDKELIDYIIEYYQEFLSLEEKAMQKRLFIASNANNYEYFKKTIAEKVLREHGDQVFINKCPRCGRLARTPLAKQCRHCGHDWH
jgi:hypothetical protein